MLMKRLGVDAIDFYISRRQLGWLGHVRRMDFDRLPRRMLSSWVPHKRPPGEPRMTFARSIGKALDVYDLDRAKWPELAADRSAWRALLACGQPQEGDGDRRHVHQQGVLVVFEDAKIQRCCLHRTLCASSVSVCGPQAPC